MENRKNKEDKTKETEEGRAICRLQHRICIAKKRHDNDHIRVASNCGGGSPVCFDIAVLVLNECGNHGTMSLVVQVQWYVPFLWICGLRSNHRYSMSCFYSGRKQETKYENTRKTTQRKHHTEMRLSAGGCQSCITFLHKQLLHKLKADIALICDCVTYDWNFRPIWTTVKGSVLVVSY